MVLFDAGVSLYDFLCESSGRNILELYITNDVAGSVIGKSGIKVAEISRSPAPLSTSPVRRRSPAAGRGSSRCRAQQTASSLLVQSNIEFFRRDRDDGGRPTQGGNVLDSFSQQEAIKEEEDMAVVAP